MFEVYYKNQLVTEYIDNYSLDYNDLLNNWKVKIDNVLHDFYIKSYRFENSKNYYYLSFHDSDISICVECINIITLKTYTFKDDVYSSDDFDKITFIEKSNYIDVVSDCSDMSNILEMISRYCKSQIQYFFDKYSNVNVSFPPSQYPYTDFKFILNNISGYLDVFLYRRYFGGDVDFEKIEKVVSFRIHQLEFFKFFSGIVDCIHLNQCNISMKNTTPSISGGVNQYYSKAEIDSKLNDIKLLIRNISTLPEGSSSSLLKLDSSQFKALSALFFLGGK